MTFQIPTTLIDAILNGHCIAFVGAGFSAAARLPGWKALLTRVATEKAVSRTVADHVQSLLQGQRPSASRFEQAAQLLEDELSRSGFVRAVGHHLAAAAHVGPMMENRLRYIKEIPFRAILTTNFDGLLDGLLPGPATYLQLLRPCSHRWWEEAFWGTERKGAPVVNLHGDLAVENPETQVVLTRRDYRRRVYEDPGYMAFLHSLLTTNTVLFMGTSFEDAYLNELRSQILALFGYERHERPVAFALLNDVHELTRQHYYDHEGIQILNFETRAGTDFQGFDDYLREIWDQTAILPRFGRLLHRKRILWVDPEPANNHAGYRFLNNALRDFDSQASHSIVQALDVPDAVEKLGSSSPPLFDLIITHWGHQHQNALRLLAALNSYPQRPPLIVFGCREFADENKLRALQSGAVAYCSTWETLFKTISQVLQPGHQTF